MPNSSNNQRLLVDCFLYSGEKDMLELRMCQLAGQVDHFIAVEGVLTFTGLERQIDRSLDTLPHFTHHVVETFPMAHTPWKREHHQRNMMLEALRPFPLDTLVMVSDVDEIPDHIPSDIPEGEVAVFWQQWYQFTFNTRVKDTWHGTRMCRLSTLKRKYPQGVRDYHTIVIEQGGWHLSWMGGATAIHEKLDKYSHQELKGNEFYGTINERIAQRWSLEYEPVFGDSHLPDCIRENRQRWEPYFVYPSKESI